MLEHLILETNMPLTHHEQEIMTWKTKCEAEQEGERHVFYICSSCLCIRIMFFLSDGRQGGGECFEAEQKNKRLFPQRSVRREGGLSQGTFYKPILPTGDN